MDAPQAAPGLFWMRCTLSENQNRSEDAGNETTGSDGSRWLNYALKERMWLKKHHDPVLTEEEHDLNVTVGITVFNTSDLTDVVQTLQTKVKAWTKSKAWCVRLLNLISLSLWWLATVCCCLIGAQTTVRTNQTHQNRFVFGLDEWKRKSSLFPTHALLHPHRD